MKAIIEEGEEEIGARMQGLALAEGALPQHLLTSLFTSSEDKRLLTNQQLSRHLVRTRLAKNYYYGRVPKLKSEKVWSLQFLLNFLCALSFTQFVEK